MTDAEIIVSLLFLAVLITLAGGVLVLVKLCNLQDFEKEVRNAEQRREQINNEHRQKT